MTEHTARPLDEVDRAMLRVLCEDGRVPGVRTTFTTLILDEHPKQQVLPR